MVKNISSSGGRREENAIDFEQPIEERLVFCVSVGRGLRVNRASCNSYDSVSRAEVRCAIRLARSMLYEWCFHHLLLLSSILLSAGMYGIC